MDFRNISKTLFSASVYGLAFALATNVMAAAPFVTVPWNGHVGAASFTFDDAMDDQIKNLTPILEEMTDVRVTFFLSNMGGNNLQRNGAGFATLAKMGNEIGNHTDSHLQLPDQSGDKLKSEITDFADQIEKVMAANGAEVKVTAVATPFCANDDKVSAEIDKNHFINRDCGWHGRNDWDVEPKWMSMASRVWNSSATAADELLGALDTAAFIGNFAGANPWEVQVKGGSWLVLLNHGVSNEGGMSITPEEIKSAFQHALKNDLWTAPFSTVGAYHKAHFTLDKAQAAKDGDGYKVSWELPHQHLPKSIPLKVKLSDDFLKEAGFTSSDKIVLDQDGNEIAADEQGNYTLEFTALSATIRKASTLSIGNPRQDRQILRNTQARNKMYDLNGKHLEPSRGLHVIKVYR